MASSSILVTARLPVRANPAALGTSARAPCVGLLALLLVVGTALALTACGPSRARMLEGEIAQAVQTSPGRVDLGKLYPAAWDRLCVLAPGVTAAAADRALGFHFAAARFLASRPDVAGLLFLRGHDAVVAMRYPRRDGDFAAGGRSYCLRRAAAVFHAVGRSPAGGPDLRPLGS